MPRQSLSIGKIFGIPIGVDFSWFLVLAMLTWTFAVGYYPAEFKNWPVAEYWILGGATALLLFVSVLLHELGHSFTARFYKIPVKGITLFIFGGVSQISEEPGSAASAFWITIVGPIVSLVLAGVLGVLALIITGLAPLLAILKYLAYANAVLGIFNLIPGYPLDGGGVLMAIVWGITHNRHRAILIAANVGRVIAYLLILFGAYQIFSNNLFNGLWTAFIGWFMLDAAGGQVQHEKIKTLLAGHHASEAMNRAYTTIQADTSVQFLIDHHILGGSRRSFIIEDQGKVVGLLTLHRLSEVPREKWPETTVSQIMLPVDKLKQINPYTELWDAIEEMDKDGVNQLPVMDGGQIEGMLTREDIISFIRRLQPANETQP